RNDDARGGLQLLQVRRPQLTDLLLTHGKLSRVADQLSRMRGAAMKAGQLLSMETSDLLPPELVQILARLRSEAHFMPPAQLKKVLTEHWGQDFLKRFSRFDVQPLAAASIGQVHRAQTKDGRSIAVKVQYPGIRDSIDSDMRNLGLVLSASGMMPDSFDTQRLLRDAAEQLHEETDYAREAAALSRFGAYFEEDENFIVPAVQTDLSNRDILSMTFITGVPVETVSVLDQETRDRVASQLVELTLRELFELCDMQTDPNFANYLYVPETGQIALLDFGATRRFAPDMVANYRTLYRSAVRGDDETAFQAMIDIGLVAPDMSDRDRSHILRIFNLAAEPLRTGGILDFGTSGLLARMRREGLVLADEQVALAAPPADTLLLQRKILGCYLLAERLKARVDLDPLIERFL
ncbi:MAG: AarF/ABC1/UbiB kinase family protein, partial [Pseudomonadota bacterium]